MSENIRPFLVDLTLLMSIIMLIVNSSIISKNFFNYNYDQNLYTRNDKLYVFIYIILIIGMHPNRYLDIVKVIYKLFNVLTKFASDNNNIIIYSSIINVVVIILCLIILKSFQLTPRIMITLGILTGIQVICRIIWGYNLLYKRIGGGISYKDRNIHTRLVDTMYHKAGNYDYDKLYEILVQANSKISIINKMKSEDRNKYILEELLKMDLSKITLKDPKLNDIKNKFQNEKDKLQKDIDDLTIKVNKLSEVKNNSDNLTKCIKKYI